MLTETQTSEKNVVLPIFNLFSAFWDTYDYVVETFSMVRLDF